MANLNIPEITKEGKEYRATLLIEKTFQKNGNMDNFMSDSGLFHASSIIIDKKEHKTYSKNLENFVIALRGQKGKTLALKGKLSGQNQEVIIPIGKIQKSVEFGGQPAGSKKVNKGIVFENELFTRFEQCINGKCCKGKYDRQAKAILDEVSKKMGSPVDKIDGSMGSKNQSRPLIISGGSPIIHPNNPEEHGEKLTDIDIIHKNGQRSHLSLKFSSTLTFVNSGVAKKYFPEGEMKTGKISNELGKTILETLGIENEKFCKVFNDYGTGGKMVDPHIVNVTGQVDKQKLKKLLETAIGSNYFMVHGMEGQKVYFWEMSKEINKGASNISGPIMLYYGGTSGTGKRIDMTFSNSYFEFKLNIRNKQSMLYPSHLMVDYKSLGATKKIEL